MNTNKKAIYFDMDGTIADLYAVDGWLDDLTNYNPRPYKEAKVMLYMATLARLLNRLQREGYHIGIISWLSKSGDEAYGKVVADTKITWLRTHLPSVWWNEITIVPYGTPKSEAVKHKNGILFDDEAPNRTEWGNGAYEPKMIMEVLKGLL